ncbi:MAG: hypothetical protein ABWZ25_17170 [Chitinophagaceae bacterium]
MKVTCFFLVTLILVFASCKKNPESSSGNLSSRTTFEPTIAYRVFMTKASPADSARGFLKDSIIVSRSFSKRDPEYYSNVQHASANIHRGYPGFSMGYDDDDKSFPYFSFTSQAFPGVPREFELNKPYSYPETGNVGGGFFLGTHTGADGMNYFINNEFPPDAGSPRSETHTSIIFLSKDKILNRFDTILLASGRITGYSVLSWGKTDPDKYLQRWDFSVDFKDLKIDE